MDLNGVWRVLPADDDLRRDGIGVEVDDRQWLEVTVPGHWRDHRDLTDADGPMLYRRAYSLDEPAAGRRRWITLDGVFYQGDVWLDGAYLGDPEGYFFPHTYDITALSRIGRDHVVAVEVTCSPERSHRGRRNITGVFQYWDAIDRTWNPGGLWRPVHVFDTGPVRIDRYRVLCRDADADRAHVLLSARLDADRPRAVTVRTLVDGALIYEVERRLARGLNEVNWNVDIAEPDLWWPRALGEQHLTTIAVEVVTDGEVSDRRQRRTGLRTVAWNDWTCSVNGERLFLKGANLAPTRADIANATPAELWHDVELAAEAGLDAVRIHGHIAPRPLYDRADDLGMLVLQDFPLQWAYARSVRDAAVEQARAAVDVLGHHPSIVMWNAHNEPSGAAIGIERATPKSVARYVAGHQLPSWNKSVLDRWVKRTFERTDPTRPCIPHSGVLPHLPLLDGTDTHFSFGWYHGQVRDLERVARAVPRVVRFISEFGAQAVPADAPYLDRQLDDHAWPDLDWEHLAEHHGLQKWVFDERVPPADYPSLAAWRDATQAYQAAILKAHIELLRRLKYRPSGGFAMFALNDAAPVVSWSVLDHARQPKLGWEALRHACTPVLVAADPLPAIVAPGDRLDVDVHVVSDLRQPIDDAIVDIVLRWASGSRQWRFGGSIGADDVAKVGTVDLEVPETLGTLTLELRLAATVAGEPVVADNQYTSVVTVPPD